MARPMKPVPLDVIRLVEKAVATTLANECDTHELAFHDGVAILVAITLEVCAYVAEHDKPEAERLLKKMGDIFSTAALAPERLHALLHRLSHDGHATH